MGSLAAALENGGAYQRQGNELTRLSRVNSLNLFIPQVSALHFRPLNKWQISSFIHRYEELLSGNITYIPYRMKADYSTIAALFIFLPERNTSVLTTLCLFYVIRGASPVVIS